MGYQVVMKVYEFDDKESAMLFAEDLTDEFMDMEGVEDLAASVSVEETE